MLMDSIGVPGEEFLLLLRHGGQKFFLVSCNQTEGFFQLLAGGCIVLCCRTRILPGFSYRIRPVNQLPEDDFLCTVKDAVHGSDPGHLVTGFQILCHALSDLHLLDNTFQATLCLLVQIGKISPELTG